MSDEIKGLAVFDDRGQPPRLFATGVCSPGSGRENTIVVIPLRPRGTPQGQPHEWEYDIDGDMIHVTPSVRISVNLPVAGQADKFPEVHRVEELFHNGGDWRVKFVRWSEVTDKLSDDHPWDYWRRMNEELMSKK